MKLTERYPADSYSLQENAFWLKHIQSFFINMLEITPVIDEKNISYSKKFHYQLKKKELNYYSKSYIHIGEIIEREENITTYELFNDEHLLICTREKDLIDYLINIESNLLVIKGKVGWGKTTLLQYFFFYLVQLSNKLSTEIFPVFISLHREIKEEPEKDKEFTIKSHFYNKILEPRLKKICETIIDIENEEFWNYIVDFPDCVDYKRESENYLKIFRDNPILAQKNILQLRSTYQKSIADILFYALKYLTEAQGKKPVVVIDDADRIDIQWNKEILEELHKLSNKFDFKVIFAVRPSTYYGVFKNDNHLMEIINPIIMDLNKPILLPYLESRKAMIINYKNENLGNIIRFKNVEIDKSKGIEFYEKMTNLLEEPENFKFISNISSGDIRNLGRLLRKYYSSEYINHNHMFIRYVQGKISVLPNWLIFVPIITNNYRTYFSGNKESSRSEEFILNLFTSRHKTILSNFIKIQILSFLINNETVNLKSFREDFINMYKKAYQNKILNSFNHTIKVLINYRLINSEEFFTIDKEEIVEKIEEISIEPAGRYYFESLLGNFEYISYMKDDFDYESMVNIGDCIAEQGHPKRYKSAIQFIDYLYKKEADMLYCLTKNGYLIYKNEYFTENRAPLFSLKIAEDLLKYGKEKIRYRSADNAETSELLLRNNILESKINTIKDVAEIIDSKFLR